MWRTDPPSSTGGIMYCFICQEPIDLAPGNIFYKLRAGTIHLDHYGVQFEEDFFEDGEDIKWMCLPCSSNKECV